MPTVRASQLHRDFWTWASFARAPSFANQGGLPILGQGESPNGLPISKVGLMLLGLWGFLRVCVCVMFAIVLRCFEFCSVVYRKPANWFGLRLEPLVLE